MGIKESNVQNIGSDLNSVRGAKKAIEFIDENIDGRFDDFNEEDEEKSRRDELSGEN